MAEEKTYYIKIQDVVVEVTKTVYHAYYRMERHARHLEEKDRQHGLVSYHALDTEDTQGEETLPSPDAASVEDEAIAHILPGPAPRLPRAAAVPGMGADSGPLF